MSATTRATASEIVRMVLEHGGPNAHVGVTQDALTSVVKCELDRLIEVGRQRGLEEARIALRRVA
jgi:hypothetical protein